VFGETLDDRDLSDLARVMNRISAAISPPGIRPSSQHSHPFTMSD
jgi:hypothetical protein